MRRTTKFPNKVRYRFKLYSPSEMCSMTDEEWENECLANNADMEEHAEEIVIRELAALHAMKVIKT
jgi:hypothetical protein